VARHHYAGLLTFGTADAQEALQVIGEYGDSAASRPGRRYSGGPSGSGEGGLTSSRRR
jgi:hypothetical protein